MRFKHLDLNLLVGLEVLLQEKSITRAAKRVHLSQSAVSGMLARLREHFDDEILAIVGKNMVLTPFGETLVEPVQDLLRQIRTTIEMKPEIEPRNARRSFNIVASDYIAMVVLSKLAQKLNQLAPGISFEIVASEKVYIEEFERGAVDLMIMPREYCIESLPTYSLLTDSFVCIVDKDNPLVGDSITLDQYMSMGHVACKFGQSGQTYEHSYLMSHGYHRRLEIVTSNFSTVPYFVTGTNHIATVHQRLARKYAQFFPIRIVPAPVDIPPLELCMQWHEYQDKDPVHTWLRRVMTESV